MAEKINKKNRKLPRLVITGSEGLIGTKIARHLSNKYEVLRLDLALGHDLKDELFVERWFKKNRNLYGMIVSHAYNPVAHKVSKKKKKCEPHEVALDELRNYFEVNSTSAFSVCKHFIKNNRRGVIVNISSLYASVSPRHDMYDNFVKPIGYSMSKAAINIMTKYFATYYGPKFRFNTVIFGGIPSSKPDPKFVARYIQHTPLRRLMTVGEATSIFDFLLDKKSSYVTGAEFYIDGGWTAW